MFDTYNNSSKECVPYEKKVTVTEKRSPTDESVELLNEFTQAAKDNIIDTVHIKNNVVDCVVIFYRMSPMVDDYEFALRFKLNGSEHKLHGVINRMYLEGRDAHYGFRSKAVLDLFVDSYSKVIAIELMRMDLKGASAILENNRNI